MSRTTNMRPLALALLLVSMPTFAAADCTLNNLKAGLLFSEIEVTDISAGNVYFEGTITNRMDVPVGGFMLHVEIKSAGRPRPLYDGSAGGSREIPGGLMPGETMPFDDWVHIGDWGMQIATGARGAIFHIELDSAVDAELRPFIELARQVGGWADEISPEGCALASWSAAK